MYDTIKLTMVNGDGLSYDYSNVINGLDNIIMEGKNKIGDFVNGTIGPLFFSISPYSINLYKGSITKYYHQTNAVEMTREDTELALESISNKLGVNMLMAKVTKIDFGINMIVSLSPIRLFDTLGQAKGYSRLEQDKGVYYKNSKKCMAFYDKGLEQRKKKQSLPAIYNNRFLCRYELKLNRVKDQLGLIYGKDLCEEKTYSKLYNMWINEFNKIVILTPPSMDINITGRTRDLLLELSTKHLNQIGVINLLKEFKSCQISGEITSKQAFDLRKLVYDMSKTTERKQDGIVNNELVNKITFMSSIHR